jgi:hypothetical protein
MEQYVGDQGMEAKCINLKSTFGHQYQVEYEESYYAQYGPNARTEDPWLMIIPCRWGEIYPWGTSTLALSIEFDAPASRIDRLMRLPWIKIHQHGSDGLTILFPLGHFDEIAQIVQPRRRPGPRALSAEHRQRLHEAAANYWFRTVDPERKDAHEESVATILGIGSDMLRVLLYFPRTNLAKEGDYVRTGRIRGGLHRRDYAC